MNSSFLTSIFLIAFCGAAILGVIALRLSSLGRPSFFLWLGSAAGFVTAVFLMKPIQDMTQPDTTDPHKGIYTGMKWGPPTPQPPPPRKLIVTNYGLEKLTLYTGDKVNIVGFLENPNNPDDARTEALHFYATWQFKGPHEALSSEGLTQQEHCTVSPQDVGEFKGNGDPYETTALRVNCNDAHYIAVQVLQDYSQ